MQANARIGAPPMATIIPLDTVDGHLVEQVLDHAFEPERRRRTAYKVREGTEWLPALSFAAIDDDDMLVGTIQCWPVALTTEDGRRHPLIMVGPVAVLPADQGAGYGKALMTASIAALDPNGDLGRTALPQVMIGDPEYYGRFWGFTNEHTGGWRLPGPFEQHRLLARSGNPEKLPAAGMLGPWRG
jgi:predicted N-acetyltransferase YhbS